MSKKKDNDQIYDDNQIADRFNKDPKNGGRRLSGGALDPLKDEPEVTGENSYRIVWLRDQVLERTRQLTHAMDATKYQVDLLERITKEDRERFGKLEAEIATLKAQLTTRVEDLEVKIKAKVFDQMTGGGEHQRGMYMTPWGPMPARRGW